MLSRTAFEVDEVPFSWEDVVLFAVLTGGWAAFEGEIREGVACLDHAEATPDLEARVESAAASFRHGRMLLSAADMEAWLDARGVAVGDWMEWVRRAVLRATWAGQLDPRATQAVEATQVADRMAVDLHCSPRGRELAVRLAEAAAAARAAPITDEGVAEPFTAEAAQRMLARLPVDVERARPRLAELARLVAAKRRFLDRVITPAMVRREVERGRLDWIRVDYRIVTFGSESQAREALLCVSEDHIPLERMAAEARAEVRHTRAFLQDIEPSLRDRLLGAATGEVLGPFPAGPEWSLVHVLGKTLPTVDDADVWRLADARVKSRAVAQQLSRRVRWAEPGIAPSQGS